MKTKSMILQIIIFIILISSSGVGSVDAAVALKNRSIDNGSVLNSSPMNLPTLILLGPNSPQLVTSSIDIKIDIKDATNLGAFEFDLVYDHSLITVTGVSINNLIGETSGCDYHKTRCAQILGPIDRTQGIKIGVYSYGVGMGFNGDGEIAVLHLKANGKPGKVNLIIQKPLVTDVAANAQGPVARNVTFDIGTELKMYLPLINKKP